MYGKHGHPRLFQKLSPAPFPCWCAHMRTRTQTRTHACAALQQTKRSETIREESEVGGFPREATGHRRDGDGGRESVLPWAGTSITATRGGRGQRGGRQGKGEERVRGTKGSREGEREGGKGFIPVPDPVPVIPVVLGRDGCISAKEAVQTFTAVSACPRKL